MHDNDNAQGWTQPHRSGLLLPLPDLGLLQEEQAVQEHASDRDEAEAEGDAPHSFQAVLVVVGSGLPEDCEQDAQHSCVDQVAPALQTHSTPTLTGLASPLQCALVVQTSKKQPRPGPRQGQVE